MYENVDGYLKDKDRQTICMHQFFMYGNYSDQYNRLTLAYLLVMEAVLDRRMYGSIWIKTPIIVRKMSITYICGGIGGD